MRVPLSWLAEYTDLPGGATAEEVMDALVRVGLEDEGSHKFDVTGPIVVGEVLEFVEEPQANGKTIRWCQVRVAAGSENAADGGESIRGIVCGASNFEVGDKVIVCLPGAVLPGNFEIAARKTYGHVSDGMLASARELGLGDDHGGILLLKNQGLDPKIGSDAIELLHLDDQAIDINVLPDRGYCLSVRGVAREYSHATGAAFRDPAGNVEAAHVSGFSVTVDDPTGIRGRTGVSRFVIRSVKNIDASKPTPAWMVSRLKLAGMRSISLVVDITNYVMLELGNPIHAYDADKVQGGITVRRAKKGESLVTLDGQTRKLDAEDLVIADESGAIGLAGVMGGASTEVSLETKNVLIEAANFDPISIARTARRHKLPSEASKRFERGVVWAVAERAAARVVQLLEVHTWGESDSLGADFAAVEQQSPIWLPENFAFELSGVEYTSAQITETLSQIGCVVAHVAGGFEVVPPTWRIDLKHKTDLIEEIARINGYDQIPVRLPVAPPGRGLTRAQQQRRRVANALAAAGLTEVLNYPFNAESQLSLFELPDGEAVHPIELANPLQGQNSFMRVSMLPGLIEAAARNLSRGLTDLALYEIGSVFHAAAALKATGELPSGVSLPSDKDLAKLHGTIPAQPKYLSALFTGDRIHQQAGLKSVGASYQDAIQAARVIASAVGLDLQLVQANPKGYHPGRTAALYAVSGATKHLLGYAGELDPALAAEMNLTRRTAILEINLDRFGEVAPAVIAASAIDVYPAATQDVSLVVDADVPAASVLHAIERGAGELLEHLELTDDYRGANLPDGKKSLTFGLRFRAADRTLTQAEATEAKEAGVAIANKLFGAEIRG
jgi:phenylalanyl-tRNA synthetase beta chain